MEACAGEYHLKYLHVKRLSRMSLDCKLFPVQYREYEIGLLRCLFGGIWQYKMRIKKAKLVFQRESFLFKFAFNQIEPQLAL